MIPIFLISALLLMSGLLQSRQPPIPQASPKEVVTNFWTIETSGGRLTPEGWHKTSRFFVRPSSPDLRVIHLVPRADIGLIDEVVKTNNRAEVSVGTIELGILDSSLHYKPSSGRAGSGAVIGATIIKFELVLSGRHWEAEPSGTKETEVIGTPEWRITAIAGKEEWITIDTAIRYVTERRNETNDPAIKKNADATLNVLKKVKR
jgi:hypothetical protein